MDLLQGLAQRQGISVVTEDVIVKWANAKVLSSGKATKMKNFRDPSLKSGLFFLDLIAAIEPRAVTYEVVTPGFHPDEQVLNAKYAISCARKIGATVFLGPEDIVEGKVKMYFTFCASLWAAELLR